MYPSIDVLTRRRERIMWLTQRRGMTALEISRELGVAQRTVQRHQAAHRRGVAPRHPGPQSKRTDGREGK